MADGTLDTTLHALVHRGPAGGPLVVLLHGRGSHEGDLFPLGRMLHPDATVVAPRAPFAGAPWGYGPGWAWYRFIGGTTPEPESFVAGQLPDEHPAFLLGVAVVVFAVGPGAGLDDGHGAVFEVAHQRVIDKLAAVVGVEPREHKRQSLFLFGDAAVDGVVAMVPGGAQHAPLPGGVDEHKAAREAAARVGAAVEDGVGLQPAGFRSGGGVFAQGDLTAHFAAGAGARGGAPAAIAGEQAVEGGRAGA